MESNFNPKASATTSSARGLYQFIDQTWLGTVKEAGSQLGYGKYADAITKSSSGSYSVSDPAARDAIMKLRDDPDAASSMAAVLTQSNSFKLTGDIGRRRPMPNSIWRISWASRRGQADLQCRGPSERVRRRLFPNAAAANRSIFYDRGGRERSVAQVYSVLTQRYDSAANSSATRSAMASAGVMPANATFASAAAGAAPIDNAAYLSSFPDSSRAATAAAASQPALKTHRCNRASRSSARCFKPANDPAGLAGGSRIVGQLDVADVGATSVTITSPISSLPTRTPNVRAPQPLDLFSDRSGAFRS